MDNERRFEPVIAVLVSSGVNKEDVSAGLSILGRLTLGHLMIGTQAMLASAEKSPSTI